MTMDERTIEILKRFDASWKKTGAWYDELINQHEGFERLIPIRKFMVDLELTGGKKLYRLGTSMHTLMISRSVDHGLRKDQKYVSIEAISSDCFEVKMREGSKIYREYRVKTLKDVRVSKLLQTLKCVLVD